MLSVAALLVVATGCVAQSCKTQSQPNPITQDGHAVSGTINGTVSILPISYDLARSIVPAQFPILRDQYQAWLPWLPVDRYPAMLQTELDHDIYSFNIPANMDFLVCSKPDLPQVVNADVPSLSAKRAGVYFPYVDRLNDGYTAMAYSAEIFLSSNASLVADVGTAVYGYTITPGIFDPPCDGYDYTGIGDEVSVRVYDASLLATRTEPAVEVVFSPTTTSPLTLDFWQNITNQPTFSRDPLVCDNYIRLLNTSVSEPPYSPVMVQGDVDLRAPYFFNETMIFEDVYGIKLDQAFIENNYVPCESLKGYSVVDAPGN